MKLSKLSIGILSVLIFASCGKKMNFGAEDNTPKEYKTQVLAQQDALLENSYPVTIKGQEDIEIRPRIDGFIEQVLVDEGSVVRKGQTLFRINSPQAAQGVTAADAALSSARSSMNNAKLNADRLRPLAEKGIISRVQLETAENSYNSSRSMVDQAQSALTQARAVSGWTNVTSPVDGVVGTLSFRLGSLVNPANVLTTVANTKTVYAYFSLNEKELIEFLKNSPGETEAEKIKNLPPLTLTLADGSEYGEKGRIETISGTVNASTGSVNFRAEFPNKAGILRSGTSGKISIPRQLKNIIVIPQAATYSQQDKVLVYKVQKDSVVQTVVEVSAMPDGKNFAVHSGLNVGDRIVNDGIGSLTNGKKIIVK